MDLVSDTHEFNIHELIEFFDENINEDVALLDSARADLAKATKVKSELLQRKTPSELFTYNSDTMNELHDLNSPLVFPFKPIVDILRCNNTSKISHDAQMYFARAASSIADEIMDITLCTTLTVEEAEVKKTLKFMGLEVALDDCGIENISLRRLLEKHRMNYQFTITPQARLTLLFSIVKNLQLIVTEIQAFRNYNRRAITTTVEDVQRVTDWWICVRPYSRTTYESRSLQARKRLRNNDGRFGI
ncbi:MAG: hypothetical protein CMB67_04605 [Euryarchaeota archaeon]|nr:hypothetical protein [Euryarchaeota archaeon]|tara:strand:- start:6137 stop:6874 length:738 start_codon:yes stop_codon:yes gene_type:complete